jgi:hypothetical protein
MHAHWPSAGRTLRQRVQNIANEEWVGGFSVHPMACRLACLSAILNHQFDLGALRVDNGQRI